MVEEFFSGNQISATSASDREEKQTMILLSGPPNSWKTSLLFQYAYNCALGSKRPIVFLCNKRRLDANPPCLSQGIDPTSNVFSQIQMKYIETDEDIRRYFSAFHLQECFPSAIIVDDFGDFFDERTSQERFGNARGGDLAMVRTLALCPDALDHANERLHPHGFCKLLLSDVHHGDGPRQLFIYKRWLSCIFTIKAIRWRTWSALRCVPDVIVHMAFKSACDGRGAFVLRKSWARNGLHERMMCAKYSVALQLLVLENLLEE